jgi:hypothetical protein
MVLSRVLAGVFVCILSVSMAASVGNAAVRTWLSGSGTWVEGTNADWTASDEPDPDDDVIFNTDVVVSLGSNNTVLSLTMSNSSELLLDNRTLSVAGLTTLSNSGTRLEISATTAAFNGQSITINNGATMFLDGGSVTSSITGATNALTTIAAGGTLSGNGDFSLTDAPAAATTLFDNNGTLTASNPSALIFTPPTAATLHLNAADADTRIDLDGSGEAGAVVVGRNQTLDIDVPLADIFNGTITMSHGTKLDVSSSWILGAGAAITVDNGATGGIGAISAGTSTIDGNSFSQNSGTITVVDADGTLQFDAPFSMNGGNLVNNGLVVFDSTAVIAAAANFTMPTTSSSLTVAANRSVTINQNNFNMDGANASTNTLTVEAGGSLAITTTDYDPDQATNAFDGTINLNDGDISVTTGNAEFVMDATLNMHSSIGGQIVAWTGEPLDIGNDAGSLDADLNVTGTQQSQFGNEVDFNADADVDVAAGATLALLGTANFNTVNGGNTAQFTGAGRIVFGGGVNVNEAVTLNLVGGEVDLDGLDNVGDFVNIDAPLTINVATLSSFGRVNGGGGVNTLDINSNVGTGSLTVNLDNAADEWTLNAAGVMNLVNDAGGGTLLAGNDVNLNGTVNVTGGVGTTARVDLAGTVNVAAASALTLQGGGLANPNRLEGGTVNGPGTFAVATGRALRGFGTINPTVNYTGTAELLADDGELTLNGNIVDAGKIGTADSDGVLNVVNAWNTSAIDNVALAGGVLKGGTVTVGNANGIQGHGTISSRVINTSKIVATGGTLLVQTSGNDNDWDGAANTGELQALGGDLEMVDTTGPVPPVRSFGGKVRAINDHRVFANGFALDFLPGSSLTLEDEAVYQASSSTDIGGTLTIGAGANATIQVANNFFLTFETGSAVTLGGDVTLKNNNIIIEQGATFTGAGALIIADGSHMVADNQADIGTLLVMDGAFRPGNFNGIGRVALLDLQESSTSETYVELIGTSLNQFDRLVAAGDVIVDGYLNIDIDEISPGVPFVPVLGNTFNIITGNTVTGTFDTVDTSGMPAGLAFHLNYLPNAVQLQVVTKPSFEADFDDDGDVDSTDYEIWRHAFKLNQLGDATGDSVSDAADYVVWRNQLGSGPGAGSGALADGGSVPEPTTFGLVVFALLGVLWQRRYRR